MWESRELTSSQSPRDQVLRLAWLRSGVSTIWLELGSTFCVHSFVVSIQI